MEQEETGKDRKDTGRNRKKPWFLPGKKKGRNREGQEGHRKGQEETVRPESNAGKYASRESEKIEGKNLSTHPPHMPSHCRLIQQGDHSFLASVTVSSEMLS